MAPRHGHCTMSDSWPEKHPENPPRDTVKRIVHPGPIRFREPLVARHLHRRPIGARVRGTDSTSIPRTTSRAGSPRTMKAIISTWSTTTCSRSAISTGPWSTTAPCSTSKTCPGPRSRCGRPMRRAEERRLLSVFSRQGPGGHLSHRRRHEREPGGAVQGAPRAHRRQPTASIRALFVDDDGTAYLYFGGIWGGQLERWRIGQV